MECLNNALKQNMLDSNKAIRHLTEIKVNIICKSVVQLGAEKLSPSKMYCFKLPKHSVDHFQTY